MPVKFRGEPLYSWYNVLIFMACYAVGELGHFLVGITSRYMAIDIHFGDKGCFYNETLENDFTTDQKSQCRKILNSTSCTNAEINGTNYCMWEYVGSGVQYQLLAGPAFIAIFTVMGLVLGVLGDSHNRVRLLFCCILLYSTAILLMGFAQEYWQLFILRFFFGAGEAGCTPLTASILGDTFSKSARGLAMSVYNWGIYLGYGSAFAVGNFVTQANINGQGWRWAYYLSAIPGFIFAVIMLLTVKEATRRNIDITTAENIQESKEPKDELSFFERLIKALRYIFTRPSIIVLLIASSVRHTASFCWAYNTQLYFDHYYPGTNLGLWMTLTSIIGGSFGIATGGLISDLVVLKYGIKMRLWVLIISQAIASPFAAGVLYFAPPVCFVSLLIAYVFAEMWFGVLFTVLVEILPLDIRTSGIAVLLFVINNIAGNGQLTVPALRPWFGFRTTLYLVYPLFYLLTEMWFGIAIAVVVESVPSQIRATAVAIFAFVISNIGGNLPVVVAPVKHSIGLRGALYVFYAGFYMLSAFLFLLAQILIHREIRAGRIPVVTQEVEPNDLKPIEEESKEELLQT